jgi:hypothetical protein
MRPPAPPPPKLVGLLAQRTHSLLAETRQLTAPPLAVSGCKGLAGIGQALLQASALLHDPALGAWPQTQPESASPTFGGLTPWDDAAALQESATSSSP